jgi:hypothetical protein
MGQGNRERELLEALREAGLAVKTIETKDGKKVVTVEKMKVEALEIPRGPVVYTPGKLDKIEAFPKLQLVGKRP